MTHDALERLDAGRLVPSAPADMAARAQRVIVRMLFDPDFVKGVYEDPFRALAADQLDEALVRQIVRNDRRLWQADRLRRRRTLDVLMKEFRATTTLVLAEWASLARLEAFFGSEEFHRAVRERGYMALAFRAWIEHQIARGALCGPALAPVLALEGAMALARRERREARRGRDPHLQSRSDLAPGPAWALVAGTRAVRVPVGTLAIVQHLERWAFEVALTPALVLCQDAPRPEPLPELRAESAHYLIECDATHEAQLADLEAPWAEVVRAAEALVMESALSADRGERATALVQAGVLRQVLIHADGTVSPVESAA